MNILRYRDIELPRAALRGPRLGGYLKCDAIRPDGRVRPLTGWFPNLITNVGMDAIAGQAGASKKYANVAVVGTDNTAPAFGDTALGAQVGQSGTVSPTAGRQATEPYYGWMQKVFVFGVGVATGNLAEVGVLAESGALFSRALILDSGGSPTTITVLADEILHVSYELRLYPPLGDVVDTIVLESISRDTIARANQVTSHPAWSDWLGVVEAEKSPGSNGGLYNGALNDILTVPGGTLDNNTVLNHGVYTGSSFKLAFTATAGLSVGNLAGGITVWQFNTTIGSYKISFDPPLDKDNTKLLSLTAEVTWARV